MLRVILIILAINLILVGFILAGRGTKKDKTIWATVLLAIPLIGLAIYYVLQGRTGDKVASLKEWEKK
jgi:uncharacterized membrane protein AbrB (regulator of aidB expression)